MAADIHHFIDLAINGMARYTEAHHFSTGTSFALVVGFLVAEIVFVYVLILALAALIENTPSLFRLLLQKCGVGKADAPQAFLELVFPADTTKSAYATEQLHILLHGLVKYYGFWDRLAGRKKPYSLELVGTKDDGVRFVLMVPASEVAIVQRNLLSFLPGLKVRQITDYAAAIPADDSTLVTELRLLSDFILPLQNHKSLEEHDPFAYLTGHMTKLATDELVAFQIVAMPVFDTTHRRITRRQRTIEDRIASGKEISSQIKTQRSSLATAARLIWYPPAWFVIAMLRVGAGILEIIFSMLSSDHELPSFLQSGRDKRSADNPYEQDKTTIVKEKLDQQLYEVTMRILVTSPDVTTHYSRMNALIEAFKPFQTTYQAIGVRRELPLLAVHSKRLAQFKARVLSPHHMSQQTVLSSSELADLYHFPNTDMTKTEGLVKSRSRELAAPLSIKRSDAQLDVIIGVNRHGGDLQEIGMTLEQRQKHTYIIGKTGTGKTTMLKASIYQDMLNGKGIAVFDPHGDMFQELLRMVPKHRQKDVVVFDPSDDAHPVGLNILDPGIEFANEDKKHARITSTVLSTFKKLADDNQWGPRMEHILRNTTLTALQLPNPSLYTLQRLLTDKKYQREVAKTLKDPVLKQFWDKEFKLLGSMQMSTVTAPLTHRLGHFITAKMSRHILLQEKSTIRMGDIMNEGKILLVNLSKGDIGEDQSLFFGTILTSFIWMAAYQRTTIPEKQRKDFFVYVDEFQNFATPQFSEITSEGRKYHIALILSHQNIAQIEDKSIVKIVASNASTLVCLKVGPEDEAFILPYMKPEVEGGDIVNLAPYHFYMKTTADESEDAFSGETVPLDVDESAAIAKAVLGQSRKKYGTPKAEVEQQMEVLFAEKPKGTARPKSSKATQQGKQPTTKKVHGA